MLSTSFAEQTVCYTIKVNDEAGPQLHPVACRDRRTSFNVIPDLPSLVNTVRETYFLHLHRYVEDGVSGMHPCNFLVKRHSYSLNIGLMVYLHLQTGASVVRLGALAVRLSQNIHKRFLVER